MAENLDRLAEFIDQPNIADLILDQEDGEQVLMKLGRQVIEDFERDLDSMAEWSDMVDEGHKLAKQETKGKSEPWEGASNFKSPAILEASISFGDRSSTELLRGRNIVKADVIGADPEGLKKDAAKRVVEFMNWQINHQMTDWREKQAKLLYELPSVGAVFKKTFFDPIEGVNKSELIHYPDFAVNQATTSIDEAMSFTQIMDFSADKIFVRQAAGIWSDVQIFPEGSDGDEGSNEEQEVEFAYDNEQRFLEQNCLFDLDGDGYREPYTVTVHQQTGKVVRIVARYDFENIFIKRPNGSIERMSPLDTGASGDLVKIQADQNIVDYCFIPSPDGTFLGVGYYHILSSLSKAINGTTNQLMDSGTLANLQGGFLARGFRKKMGNERTKPGAWISTDISAQDLANGIRPHAFKEPSATLFQLNESLKAQISQLSLTVDLKGTLAPNAPATTTLALIQEAMIPQSAIMQRVICSESKEFKKLFILDSKFTDPATYQEVVDDSEANFANDFRLASMDIAPTANPEMSSKMQRLQMSEALMLQAPQVALQGGDTRPILDMWLESIGAEELIGQVFPDPEDVTEEQKARIAAQQEQQRQQAQLMAIQIDHAEREIARKEAETRAKLSEAAASIRKTESDIILNLEKAESEQVKNQINLYTAQLQGVREAIEATIRESELDNAERLSRQPATAATSTPNIPS